jgi:hypothetical protein
VQVPQQRPGGVAVLDDEMQTVVLGEVLEILDVEGGQPELVR